MAVNPKPETGEVPPTNQQWGMFYRVSKNDGMVPTPLADIEPRFLTIPCQICLDKFGVRVPSHTRVWVESEAECQINLCRDCYRTIAVLTTVYDGFKISEGGLKSEPIQKG